MAPSAKADSLRLSAALEWRSNSLGSTYGGMVLLEIPFDRLAQGSTVTAEPPLESETRAVPTTDAAPAHADLGLPRRPRELPVSRTLPDRRWARSLVAAALRAAGNSGAHARLDSITQRARASAVLPELSLRAARSTAETLRLTPSGVDRFDYTQTGGADLILEARASWKLDRLVFSDEELRVESLRAAREQARLEIVTRVLKLLFTWHRARARLGEPELDPETELELELDALEAEAALDVLTEGHFSATLARRKSPSGTR